MDHQIEASEFTKRRIFSVLGVLPEPGGYGIAKFSRSSEPYQKWVMDLTQEGAEKFYETFYFDYGHSSIADLSHLTVIFENISMIAAEELWDEPLIDGQASSTRYQDFEKRGFHTPAEIAGTEFEQPYRKHCALLLKEYSKFLVEVHNLLIKKHADERPDEMPQDKYERTLKARAFDVVRYTLPMSIRTGLGHILSARTLERRLIQLLSHPLQEIREIGVELKSAAVEQPAFNPMVERLRPILSELKNLHKEENRISELIQEIKQITGFDAASTPTLIKYAEPSEAIVKTRRSLKEFAAEFAPRLGEPDNARGVSLAQEHTHEEEQVSTLLYTVLPHSYDQIQRFVASELSEGDRARALAIAQEFRREYDPPPLQTRSGYSLIFDLNLDMGAWRDFHRHRKLVQIHKEFDASIGFDIPALIEDGPLEARYIELMEQSGELALSIDEAHSGIGQYALPFAFRKRSLLKMDAEELQYITELRTGPENHFSVREIAYEMYERYAERYPKLAKDIRVVHPDREDFFQR